MLVQILNGSLFWTIFLKLKQTFIVRNVRLVQLFGSNLCKWTYKCTCTKCMQVNFFARKSFYDIPKYEIWQHFTKHVLLVERFIGIGQHSMSFPVSTVHQPGWKSTSRVLHFHISDLCCGPCQPPDPSTCFHAPDGSQAVNTSGDLIVASALLHTSWTCHVHPSYFCNLDLLTVCVYNCRRADTCNVQHPHGCYLRHEIFFCTSSKWNLSRTLSHSTFLQAAHPSEWIIQLFVWVSALTWLVFQDTDVCQKSTPGRKLLDILLDSNSSPQSLSSHWSLLVSSQGLQMMSGGHSSY